MSKRPPLIIHHKGCSDGICGALILHLGLDDPDAELRPYHYNWDPPSDDTVRDREVWIVDFSFPRETLAHMNEVADKVVVLDHHGTAQANCEGLDFATFDMDRSGAMLAYDRMSDDGYFEKLFKDGRLPDGHRLMLLRLAQYVQDRDLWQWKLPKSKEVSAWIASHRRELPEWQGIYELFRMGDSAFEDVVRQGEAIVRSNDSHVGAIVGKAYLGHSAEWTDAPVVAWVANAPVLQSDAGHALLERGDADCALLWSLGKDGKFFYSLRSLAPEDGVEGDSFDVAKLASEFGGGGHKASAGFTSALPPWKIFYPIPMPKEGDDE